MPNFNKYTIKAGEAVQAAHDMALQMQHGTIDTAHVVQAMLQQADGFVPQVLKKAGVSVETMQSGVTHLLA